MHPQDQFCRGRAPHLSSDWNSASLKSQAPGQHPCPPDSLEIWNSDFTDFIYNRQFCNWLKKEPYPPRLVMGTCKPTGGRSWRDQNTLSISFWQEFTQHIHQVEGGKSKHHNPNISAFVSPHAHIMKEAGEVFLGVLVPPPACRARCLATTTAVWLHLVSAIWLLHISPAQGPAQTKALQNCSPWDIGVPGSGQSEVVHTSLRSRRAPLLQDCRTVGPQLLGAFLTSLGQHLSWHEHLNQVSQDYFLKVMNTFENAERSKPAPKTRALSVGRAWLWASCSLQHRLALVHPLDTPGRKDHPLLPPSQCHCCSPRSLINGVHKRAKFRVWHPYGLFSLDSYTFIRWSSTCTNRVGLLDNFQILDTRHLSDQLPKSQGILT